MMDARQRAVNEALWAAIEECSKVESFMFKQQRAAPSYELAVQYQENAAGAVMCKRRLEDLLVRVNRGEELQAMTERHGVAQQVMCGEKPESTNQATVAGQSQEVNWHDQDRPRPGKP